MYLSYFEPLKFLNMLVKTDRSLIFKLLELIYRLQPCFLFIYRLPTSHCTFKCVLSEGQNVLLFMSLQLFVNLNDLVDVVAFILTQLH